LKTQPLFPADVAFEVANRIILNSRHTLDTAVSTACFSSNLASAVPAGTMFDHFFIIVLENTDYATALQQPYMKSLTTHTNPNGRLLSNYVAVSHPSEVGRFSQLALFLPSPRWIPPLWFEDHPTIEGGIGIWAIVSTDSFTEVGHFCEHQICTWQASGTRPDNIHGTSFPPVSFWLA
jgi:hypothetical protein